MSSYRLASGGACISRDIALSFTFEGRSYQGCAGDTLASALLANGVGITNRSFKYSRPRGVFTAGVDEPNSIVQLGHGNTADPNNRTTAIPLTDGLQADSVGVWPSAANDVGSLAGLLSPLLGPGFYYKTFMWPQTLWQKLYEPMLRSMAGLGHCPDGIDPDRYLHTHRHVDVLVVGGGVAGRAAANSAAMAGASVLIADEGPGAIAVDAADTLTALSETTAFGLYDQNYACLLERNPAGLPTIRQRIWHVRARHIILATGAHERPLVFENNDLPGIQQASAITTYARDYGVSAGRQVAIVTNNDSAWQNAATLLEAGVGLSVIVDVRSDVSPDLIRPLTDRGVTVLTGSEVTRAIGGKHIKGIEVVDGNGKRRTFACDALGVSGGWSPVVHLYCHRGGKLSYDDEQACLLPVTDIPGLSLCGATAGVFGEEDAAASGRLAGEQAVESLQDGTPLSSRVLPARWQPLNITAYWRPSTGVCRKPGRAFVDYQSDVTLKDIDQAIEEGFHSVEHLKRYTATGMGTDQGKTSNLNALALLSLGLGQGFDATGTTTFRPPYTPVTIGALAGRNLGELADPVRTTTLHGWHLDNGAVFEDVGQWKRPLYFTTTGEDMHAAVLRECKAVRTGVGMLDASTLGKIDIQGPDAPEFLHRIYSNGWLKLGVDKCRYGLMLRDTGMVFDDGVTTRLSDNRFLLTTTTGNAAAVLDWLEDWLQTEWPDLKVYCSTVTDQWATLTLAGPKARKTLAKVCHDIDLTGDAFAFMESRSGHVAGVPVRINRISFSGELSFEVNVAADVARGVWEALMAAGEEFGITPYGTETMHVLRAEKGFIIVGQETDGTQTPGDLGMDWAVSKKKDDFVGMRGLTRTDLVRDGRKQMVGLLPEDPTLRVVEGTQLQNDPGEKTPMKTIGHVTSFYDSPALGRHFGLALLADGSKRHGETVYMRLGDKCVPAKVCSPILYDAENALRDGEELEAIAPQTDHQPRPAAFTARVLSDSAALREAPPGGQLALRAHTPDGIAALEKALTITLPGTVGEVSRTDRGTTVICCSPDEWLYLCPDQAVASTIASVESLLSSHHVGVTDVSRSRAVLELSGPTALHVLECGCRADLRSVPVGAAKQTRLGKTAVILLRDSETAWRILVRHSFAEYLACWLRDALDIFAGNRPG